MFVTESDFTLIIPTHNRSVYLKRILSYYYQQNCKFQFIICDSSAEAFQEISFFSKKLNISYFHVPKLSYADKLYSVADLIKTDYASFCADDDFIFIDSILKCIEFLKYSPDYVSVQGKYFGFSKTGKLITTYPIYSGTLSIDLNQASPSLRLKEYNKKYFLAVYSVHRGFVLRKTLKLFENVKNIYLLELLMGYNAIIQGAHKILPILYSAREKLSNSAGSSGDNLEVVFNDSKYKQEYVKFIECISKCLSEKETISIAESSHHVKEVLDMRAEVYKNKSAPVDTETYINQGVVRKIKNAIKSIVSPKLIFKLHKYSHEKSCRRITANTLNFNKKDYQNYRLFISFIKEYTD